jgi:hypothetical protein
MIEYSMGERATKVTLKVKLDGKYCGDIKPVGDKWAYFPKGKKEHGEIFSTTSEVQNDLEG